MLNMAYALLVDGRDAEQRDEFDAQLEVTPARERQQQLLAHALRLVGVA